MIDFCTFREIRDNAIKSIKSDSDGEQITRRKSKVLFVLYFYALPLFAFILSLFLNVQISDFGSYLTVGISIFTGLFFSLLLNISSKVRIEKENKNKDISNFQKYKENMRQISNITQFVICLGISIMLMIILFFFVPKQYECIRGVVTAISLYLLINYFVCLFFILQRFHYVLRDEIDNIF